MIDIFMQGAAQAAAHREADRDSVTAAFKRDEERRTAHRAFAEESAQEALGEKAASAAVKKADEKKAIERLLRAQFAAEEALTRTWAEVAEGKAITDWPITTTLKKAEALAVSNEARRKKVSKAEALVIQTAEENVAAAAKQDTNQDESAEKMHQMVTRNAVSDEVMREIASEEDGPAKNMHDMFTRKAANNEVARQAATEAVAKERVDEQTVGEEEEIPIAGWAHPCKEPAFTTSQKSSAAAEACHADFGGTTETEVFSTLPMTTEGLTAAIRVVRDDGCTSSEVHFMIYSSRVGPLLPQGWRLCFTWLRAVALRAPPGACTAGSYVELPPQAALGAGEVRTLTVHLGPPAMRYASDLPQNLFVVAGHWQEEKVWPVNLVPPATGDIRFESKPSGPSGLVPQPLEEHRENPKSGFSINTVNKADSVDVLINSEKAHDAARLLQVWLLSWPPESPLAVSSATQERGMKAGRRVVFEDASSEQDKAWLGTEGYELQVAEKELRIIASAAGGFNNGAATLRQALGMAHSEGKERLPVMQIKDRPRFSYRGVMLDVSRHFFPVPFLKKLLQWMHLYKLNVFHWHLTDDEGWRFEVKALPNLTKYGAWRGRGEVVEPQYGSGPGRYGGFYSHEEIREVVSFAAERGIAIVPEIDVPAHCYAAVRALPERLRVRRPLLRSVQGFPGNVLDPAAPATYKFLEAVLTEVLDLFPAPLGVHVGMDEIPRGAWSDSQKEEAKLKAKLLKWLQEFLAERGRALLGWEEAFYGQGLNPRLTPRAMSFAWRKDESSAVKAANLGFDVVLCPAQFLYLDMVQGRNFEDRGHTWAAHSLPLERVYAYEPVDGLRRLGLAPDIEPRIRGLQANLWSETVDSSERAEEMLFPRLLAAAEVMWSAREHRDWDDFIGRVAPQITWLSREEGLEHWGGVSGVLADGHFLRVPRRQAAVRATR